MLTRKQLTFLKYLKTHEPLSYDQIKLKYSEKELIHTFEALLRRGYIDDDRPPVTVINNISSQPRQYFLSDEGINVIEQAKDQQQGFFRHLFVDKAANALVSAIVAFITAIITYIIMPHILSWLSLG